MKKTVTILVLIAHFHGGIKAGAQGLEDSLQAEIEAATGDTVKARLYNRLFNVQLATDLVKAVQTARNGLAWVTTMNWPKGIAVFKQNLGQVYSINGLYDSAITYYQEALVIHLANKDAVNISSTYNNMGTAAQNIKSDYAAAARFYFKARDYAEEGNDKIMQTTAISNIAKLYSLQYDHAKALHYAREAMNAARKAGNTDLLAGALETMGITWYSLKRIDSARYYYGQAIVLFEQTENSFGLASVLSNQALTFGSDFARIIETRLRAKALFNETAPLHISAITNTGNLGNAYLDLVRTDSAGIAKTKLNGETRGELLKKAGAYLTLAIGVCEQLGENDTRASFLGSLAEVQEHQGDYQKAYYNYKAYSELMDSVYSQEAKNKIAAAESQQALDKKNNELAVQDIKLRNQRITLWGLGAGILVAGFVGLLFYRQNQFRKKINRRLSDLNNELAEANRLKTTFFGILSHDLRAPLSRLVNFLHLQQEDPLGMTADQKAAHGLKITQATTALLDNIDSILLWSKGQMEKFAPEKKRVPVSSLFDHLGSFFQSAEEIRFSFSVPPGLVVFSDENYLKTILQNLTANSIAAMEKSSDKLISWKAWAGKDKIFLSIEDKGPGFPAAIIDNPHSDPGSIGGRKGYGWFIIRDMAKAIGCSVTRKNTPEGSVTILEL